MSKFRKNGESKRADRVDPTSRQSMSPCPKPGLNIIPYIYYEKLYENSSPGTFVV